MCAAWRGWSAPVQAGEGMDGREWRFLLAGPTASSAPSANPAPDWLTEQSWIEITSLAALPGFASFDAHVAGHLDHYKAIFDSSEVGNARGRGGGVTGLQRCWNCPLLLQRVWASAAGLNPNCMVSNPNPDP
jgi:hypothetical protein